MYAPLPDPIDKDQQESVDAENLRYQQWFFDHLSARSPYPIIVNGDFGIWDNSYHIPTNWTSVGSIFPAKDTSPGLGSSVCISAGTPFSSNGISQDFNVKPCTFYTVIADIKGPVAIKVKRGATVLDSVSYSLGSTWVRLPAINYRSISFKTSSTDTSLTLQLLASDAVDPGCFAEVQIWEGSWPRPFQDIGQGITKYFSTNRTGGGSAALGANAPNQIGDLTGPYTWVQMNAADGTTVFFPVWA